MADTCEWGSFPVRFKIRCLKSCWVCAPPRNIMSSILLLVINLSRDHFHQLYVSFFLAVLFFIVYSEYFNVTFYYILIYSFIRLK